MHAVEAARKSPVTVTPDQTITEAADLMDRTAVGALVVTEPDGRPSASSPTATWSSGRSLGARAPTPVSTRSCRPIW